MSQAGDTDEFDTDDEWEEPSDPTIPLTPTHRLRPTQIAGPAVTPSSEMKRLDEVPVDDDTMSKSDEGDVPEEVTGETRRLVRPRS
jgi:hypothetical protein